MVRRSAVVLCLAAALTVGGCSGDEPEPAGVEGPEGSRSAAAAWPGGAGPAIGDDPTAWWPVATATELTPTGLDVVVSGGVDSLVVDGAGAAWVIGPWQLTRVDPSAGRAQSWDISDDAAFATRTAVRPARSGGVWLVLDDRLRLFDGHRFVRDLPVPAAYRGGQGGSVNDMLEVGSEVWVSSPAGVARCNGESWSHVGAGRIGGAGGMALDSAGDVWTLAQTWTGDGFAQQVLRFDGTTWSGPDAGGAPPDASEIVAVPQGGVAVRSGASVHRFDGLSWRELAFAADQVVAERRLLDLAVAPDGTLWVLGSDGVARAPAGSPWGRVAAGSGSADPVALGVSAAGVLVADETGLSRLDGDRIVRVWADPAQGPVVAADGMVAVSSSEAWVRTADSVMRIDAGRWETVEADPIPWTDTAAHAMPGMVRATDGAVWTITDQGVVRHHGASRVLIARDRPDQQLLPGPDGAVWVAETRWPGWTSWYSGDSSQGRRLALLRPDGTQAVVVLPGHAWSLTSLAAGADGSLWATICSEDRSDYCTEPDLMRWDGSWAPVAYPGMRPIALAVSADGALWATLVPRGGPEAPNVLARYARGVWSTFPEAPSLHDPVLEPDGGICGVGGAAHDIHCVDGTGTVRSFPMGVPGTISVGADGAVWITDRGQLARLPVSVSR